MYHLHFGYPRQAPALPFASGQRLPTIPTEAVKRKRRRKKQKKTEDTEAVTTSSNHHRTPLLDHFPVCSLFSVSGIYFLQLYPVQHLLAAAVVECWPSTLDLLILGCCIEEGVVAGNRCGALDKSRCEEHMNGNAHDPPRIYGNSMEIPSGLSSLRHMPETNADSETVVSVRPCTRQKSGISQNLSVSVSSSLPTNSPLLEVKVG